MRIHRRVCKRIKGAASAFGVCYSIWWGVAVAAVWRCWRRCGVGGWVGGLVVGRAWCGQVGGRGRERELLSCSQTIRHHRLIWGRVRIGKGVWDLCVAMHVRAVVGESCVYVLYFTHTHCNQNIRIFRTCAHVWCCIMFVAFTHISNERIDRRFESLGNAIIGTCIHMYI